MIAIPLVLALAAVGVFVWGLVRVSVPIYTVSAVLAAIAGLSLQIIQALARRAAAPTPTPTVAPPTVPMAAPVATPPAPDGSVAVLAVPAGVAPPPGYAPYAGAESVAVAPVPSPPAASETTATFAPPAPPAPAPPIAPDALAHASGIPSYDGLNAATVIAHVRSDGLSDADLRTLRDYEAARAGRKGVLAAIDKELARRAR